MSIFEYGFMQRAFLVGILLAVITPLIGMTVVLKRMSMVGDALAHASLAGVAIGMLFGINPVAGAGGICVVAALAIEAIRRRLPRYSENAIAIVMSAGNMSVNKYHKKSSSMVKASAQKEVFEKIEPFLTDEEMAVYKRGRNSKSGSVAKNASMMDYRKATGVEALVGYLYLAGDMDRIIELIGIGFDLNKKEEIGEEHES